MKQLYRRSYDGVVDENELGNEIYNILMKAVWFSLPKKVSNIIDSLRHYCYSEPLLPDLNYIHLNNGKLDLNGNFYTDKEFCLNRLNIDYDPMIWRGAYYPERFLQFLCELLYPEDIAALQEYLGYLLIPSTKGQKMMFLIGQGGEGKSRIAVVLNDIFGKNTGNEHSRYYYNLTTINSKVAAGTATSGEKLLIWTLRQGYVNSENIEKYFCDSSKTFSGDTLSGDIDLTGISYYPINITWKVTIADGTVLTFRNKEIELSEAVVKAKGNTDEQIRSTSVKASQHYMMHYGLFIGDSGEFDVNGSLGLKGTVGYDDSYSGALICGTASGNTAAVTNPHIWLTMAKSEQLISPVIMLIHKEQPEIQLVPLLHYRILW